MKNWIERPFETRNLFNPAFCGMLLLRGMRGYEEVDSTGIPYSLSLLILPLCLHKSTRSKIAEHPKTSFLSVLEKHQDIRLGFAERTRSLFPHSMEGLALTYQLGSFTVSPDGKLVTTTKGIRKTVSGTLETIECQKVARIVGKEFARINHRATIYTSLGVKP